MIDLEVEPTTTVTSNLILDSLNKRKDKIVERVRGGKSKNCYERKGHRQ